MRISQEEISCLKSAVFNKNKNSKVYIFGSRVYDNKKGGDIDILVLSDRKFTRDELNSIREEFWAKFGQQKLDIASFTFDSQDPFKEYVMHEAKEL